MKEILKKILSIEYEFFTQTKNIGKPAICQSQKGNFIASRTAYWNIYTKDILSSYLNDLENAKKNHQNLISLKYAYMMEFTDPDSFAKIKHRIPKIDNEKKTLVNTILFLYMLWEKEVQKHFPNLDNQNRKLYATSDTLYSTSVETYMRGELSSYSIDTLKCILPYFWEKNQKGENLVYTYLKNLEKYSDLDMEKEHLFTKDFSNQNISNQDISEKNIIDTDFSNTQLSNIQSLNLESAKQLAIYAQEYANQISLPIVITIVDSMGLPLLFYKMDSSLLASVDISPAKAKTAIEFKTHTHQLNGSEIAKCLENFKAKTGEYCFLGGGLVIFYHQKPIGAIGISGGTVEQDIWIGEQSIAKFIKTF